METGSPCPRDGNGGTDKNHARIVGWSMGNEAGNGVNFYACYDRMKDRDGTIPVQYERASTG